MSLRVRLAAAAAAAMAGAVALGGAAWAHEHRVVGEYQLEVGFLEEPAVVGEPNGVFPGVLKGAEVEGEEAEGVPVQGIDETLNVELIVGGGAAKKELSFEPVEGEPGSYVARFIPTIAGDYTFRIFGDIEGTAIDESFESGPGRFDSVEDVAELQFPETVTAPGTLDQTVAELQEKVDSLGDGDSASDGTARALGVAGIVVGLAGLGVAGFAVMKRRS